MHCIGYLNIVVPWWKLLGEELWQGVRAPLGELTYNRCGNRLKDDKLLHTNPNFACGYTAQVPFAVSSTVFGKSIGANSTYPLNQATIPIYAPHAHRI